MKALMQFQLNYSIGGSPQHNEHLSGSHQVNERLGGSF